MGVLEFENLLGLRKVASSIVVIVDGLGAQNISAAKAHARFLAPALTKASTISTVFPSTTASALPTFTTGKLPGQHGMVGYRVRVPETGTVVNQLTGLGALDGFRSWLLEPPLYAHAREHGIRPVVVAKARFAQTPLTKLIHSGAETLGAATIGQRCEAALLAVKAGRALVVVYISELDELAHAQGVDSHAWASKLEEVDSELSILAKGLPRDVSLFVTADHGVIDIATHAHVLYGATKESMEGISAVGGEPRCLQLYVDDVVDAQAIASAWQERLGDYAFVATREQMMASGWLGDVSKITESRLGDVFVLARKAVVFFDARDPTNKARNMIGHHGGISSAEMKIPFICLN
ncbi:MAG: alkaline phosphatase family protein [Actinomycetales bacterium]|nr:alkaline phosphatase family protein [Actinomycetales bacterium]